MRMFTYPQLQKEKGVPGSRATDYRKRKQGKRPKSRHFGRLRADPEPLWDEYIALIATGHSEEQATILAEKFFGELVAKGGAAK